MKIAESDGVVEGGHVASLFLAVLFFDGIHFLFPAPTFAVRSLG